MISATQYKIDVSVEEYLKDIQDPFCCHSVDNKNDSHWHQYDLSAQHHFEFTCEHQFQIGMGWWCRTNPRGKHIEPGARISPYFPSPSSR
jgi:hypothetical protein